MALNDFPIWLNAAVFAVAGFVVWGAGTRLAVLVDGIARRSGIGHAFLGMLLLGGITSLPEVATVASASYVGNASLAVNNLLGSAAINLVLLAIADAILGRDALTSVVLKPQVPLRRPNSSGIIRNSVAAGWLALASGWLPTSLRRRGVRVRR
jgi:cation:H+ antiporter